MVVIKCDFCGKQYKKHYKCFECKKIICPICAKKYKNKIFCPDCFLKQNFYLKEFLEMDIKDILNIDID